MIRVVDWSMDSLLEIHSVCIILFKSWILQDNVHVRENCGTAKVKACVPYSKVLGLTNLFIWRVLAEGSEIQVSLSFGEFNRGFGKIKQTLDLKDLIIREHNAQQA